MLLDPDQEDVSEYKSDVQECRVFEKIYLDLQVDEVEFANPEFQKLYSEIIDRFANSPEMGAETFVNDLEPEMAIIVTNILMEEERYSLSDWERMDIYVKQKEVTIAQIVSETILNLRRFLVTKKINELSENLRSIENAEDTEEGERESNLQEVVDYIGLKKLLSDRLNRVL